MCYDMWNKIESMQNDETSANYNSGYLIDMSIETVIDNGQCDIIIKIPQWVQEDCDLSSNEFIYTFILTNETYDTLEEMYDDLSYKAIDEFLDDLTFLSEQMKSQVNLKIFIKALIDDCCISWEHIYN